ncbi:MAG: hypothetical protein NTZ49_05415 [Candidatus Parcubacteria bacterium]|nr:hypothetical protein [Candidatus Parcubacteria bacterium]
MYNINYIEFFILNTVIYFDLFDYPLTSMEIHQYLYSGGMYGGNFSLAEIEDSLKNSPVLSKLLTAERGFYILNGRNNIIDLRLERYNLAAIKYKLAKRAVRIFKFLPFIKLIAVCNSLSFNNAREESDIDLFIITSKGRLWITRLALIIIITLLGLRPPKEKAKDKICLSFYAAEDNLDLSEIKIDKDDIYLDFWLATLQPIYQRENCYAKLIGANPWLQKYFPNFLAQEPGDRLRVSDTGFSKAIYKSKEYILRGVIGNWLEDKVKKIQRKLMSQRKKDMAVIGDKRVIITDSMLKFHETDRRLEYLEKFEKKRDSLLSQY